MGPSATYDLANKIIANTQADCDQKNIHVCIDWQLTDPTKVLARAAIFRAGGVLAEEI